MKNSTPNIQLTKRELEILFLTQSGKSVKQIADQLNLSNLTVRDHIVNVRQKLQAKNTVEAVAKALQFNLVKNYFDPSNKP